MKIPKRTSYCGEVTKSSTGSAITLNGWVHRRRDHGGVIFIDLRDRTGLIQLVFNPEGCSAAVLEQAHKLRNEYVIAVVGTVTDRAPEAVNPHLATGAIEVAVNELVIINASKPLPFQIDDADSVDEELRLQYRYLDLRRPRMHNFLKKRHELIYTLRTLMNGEGFYEIETPLLSKSTPEGARDFLVPSRMNAGTFYALPQSPQIYKQLLMASGMERYFQIARCFRDEDLRANRQPEFTQLDVEMSFIDESDIMGLMERVVTTTLKRVFDVSVQLPLRRFSYDEMFEKYGSDKPDLRFEMPILRLTDLFAGTELSFLKAVIAQKGSIGAICVKNHHFSRTELEKWVSYAVKDMGAAGLLYVRFAPDGSVDSPVSKFLSADFFARAQQVIPGLTVNDTLFVMAGQYTQTWTKLGRLRLALGDALGIIDFSRTEMFWVTEFPLVEWDPETKRYYAVHHPFTAPLPGWEQLDPQQVKARAYDLVCNGEELGGGSIRIHSSEEQEKIFALLGIDKEKARDKFGHLLASQEYGCPTLGGIALGLDRFVMLFTGAQSIRDVIAFPKTQSGTCLMMQTPCAVEAEQLKELHIAVKHTPK